MGLKVKNEKRAIISPLHVKVNEPTVLIKKEPAIYPARYFFTHPVAACSDESF
jgi:hypothetical protein